MDAHTLIESLRSDLCPACGNPKKPAQTLCKGCYFKLPAKLRSGLYDRVGDGYEEAFAAAMTKLGVTAPLFYRENEPC